MKDTIRVKDRLLNLPLSSGSRWPAKTGQGTLQPISLSIDIIHDVAAASMTDDLELSINYSSISKQLESALTHQSNVSYASLEDVVNRALAVVQGTLTDLGVTELKIKVVQLKAPLHCKDVGLEAWSARKDGKWCITRIRHFVTDFVRPTIVGVNDVEREEEQNVVVNISVDTHETPLDHATLDFRGLARTLWTAIRKTSYLTLEALTTHVAKETLASLAKDFDSDVKPSVTVAVAKPCALVYASASEVEITRTHDDFQSISHKAAIAFGSNLEDRFYNIEYALRLLEDPPPSLSIDLGPSSEISVIDTSFLYETAPMYVTDQPAFINGACLVETNLRPRQLLQLLKAIESEVGRTPTVRNGPRVVDLDIIFYDNLILDTRDPSQRFTLDNLAGELVIPHPRLQEREFALRPLADMIPDYVHPVLQKSVGHLLKDVPRGKDEPPMCKVIPIPAPSTAATTKPPATLTYWLHPAPPSYKQTSLTNKSGRKTKTCLMAALNITPDSFSDGSEHNTLPSALSYVEESISSGAGIIDIGGYSTRPGAAFVSTREEIQRVTPVVEAIRSAQNNETYHKTPISIDTFRPEVAEAAIKAGANIINDVYAFTGPQSGWQRDEEALETMNKMKQIAREYATPVVLMHSRADAGKDKSYSAYAYAEQAGTSAVVEGVRVELGSKVELIVKGKGGVRRWLVIVDPGIGFSKTVEDNLELLRNGAKVVDDVDIGQEHRRRNPLAGFPTLIGTSRKSFIGGILAGCERKRETTPKERVWATAAGVTCAVQQGAMIVRIHDVKEMADVVTMADSLWP